MTAAAGTRGAEMTMKQLAALLVRRSKLAWNRMLAAGIAALRRSVWNDLRID
jgi:hypothetical protein